MSDLSSDEDDVFEYLPVKNTDGCIADLYVSRTKLVDFFTRQRHPFWGLYCHHDIKRGELIGMYRGEWTHESIHEDDDYSVQLSFGLVVSPGPDPNPQEYPIAMANEPNANQEANATLVEYTLGPEHVRDIPATIKDKRFFGVGLVACRDIAANTEIVWNYGSRYQDVRREKNYVSGAHCEYSTAPPDPLASVGLLPYDAVSPWIDSPISSSDSEDDPTYRSLVTHLLHFCKT